MVLEELEAEVLVHQVKWVTVNLAVVLVAVASFVATFGRKEQVAAAVNLVAKKLAFLTEFSKWNYL